MHLGLSALEGKSSNRRCLEKTDLQGWQGCECQCAQRVCDWALSSLSEMDILTPKGQGPFRLPLMELQILEEVKVTQIVWTLFCPSNCLIIQVVLPHQVGLLLWPPMFHHPLCISNIALKSPRCTFLNLSCCCSNMVEVLEGNEPFSHLCFHRSMSVPNPSLEHRGILQRTFFREC